LGVVAVVWEEAVFLCSIPKCEYRAKIFEVDVCLKLPKMLLLRLWLNVVEL
jgi:hypothetical protein